MLRESKLTDDLPLLPFTRSLPLLVLPSSDFPLLLLLEVGRVVGLPVGFSVIGQQNVSANFNVAQLVSVDNNVLANSFACKHVASSFVGSLKSGLSSPPGQN